MEKRIRNRVALLGGLFVIGLTLAGIGNALGAGTAFQGIEEGIRAIATGDQVTIYKGDKVVQNFTLQEGQEYTWNTSNGGIYIGRMTKEEIEKKQAGHEAEFNESLEVAMKDSRVQEIIAGKGYRIVGAIVGAGEGSALTGTGQETGNKMSTLTFKVEDKYYRVMIDMKNETVTSVEEQSQGEATGCFGPGCNK
ncbi:MAG: hypothetical protein FIB08_04715 [Candidatus Methanoperedens sp.]|nr:hypothetical protein [Candidatus Methanoperedens sp.]